MAGGVRVSTVWDGAGFAHRRRTLVVCRVRSQGVSDRWDDLRWHSYAFDGVVPSRLADDGAKERDLRARAAASAGLGVVSDGVGATDPADQLDGRVDQAFQTEANDQRADQQQTGIGDQIRFIEDDVNPVDGMRYSRHWKCLLG